MQPLHTVPLLVSGILTGYAIEVAVLSLVVWLHGIRAVVVTGLPAHVVQELGGRGGEGRGGEGRGGEGRGGEGRGGEGRDRCI